MSRTPPKLDYRQVDSYRRAYHRSVLLFITDRCPVGCAHCSVDSRTDSPTISDVELFKRLVEGIASLDSVALVGISGGEPFVERRGLEVAVAVLREADKLIVPYTSGLWAKKGVADWVKSILRQSSAVFLSTDAYHAAHISEETFVRAATMIVEQDAGLIVQAIGTANDLAEAERLLGCAFGTDRPTGVEIHPTTPLPYGRGNDVFHMAAVTAATDFGPCSAVAAPVIRYDGVVTACCNEEVIMGRGPNRLRAMARDQRDIWSSLESFAGDPVLRAIHHVGPGPLTAHPALADLGRKRFRNICDLCWKSLDHLRSDGRDEPVITAVSLLAGPPR